MTNQAINRSRINNKEVLIRPARLEDRAEIEAIAAQIWDGYDYLPHVFAEWVADHEGNFNVLAYQGKIIAVSKLTRFAKDEWWIEGLRVDPSYQGRGVAHILHHYTVAQARQKGEGILRFSTGSYNAPVFTLAAETGFREVGRFTLLKAPSKSAEPVTWWKLGSDDMRRVLAWLEASAYFGDAQESFEDIWQWFKVTEDYLHHRLEAGEVYGWNPVDKNSLNGLMVINPPHEHFDEGEKPSGRFAYLDAEPSQRRALWQAARGLAAEMGYAEIYIHLLDVPAYVQPALDAGWQNGREADENDLRAVLFARYLSLTQETPVRFEELPTFEN